MSHIVKCTVQMKNKSALDLAIAELGLENLGDKTHTLYNNQKAKGVGVKLPDWNYPVVINTETGEAKYDNYGGSWGKQQELDKLVQRYSVEVSKEQAVAGGYTCVEEMQENGDVELTMTQLASA